MSRKRTRNGRPAYLDADACLQAWFEALGPMTGASSKTHVSGIIPLEERIADLRKLFERTQAARGAGIRVPVFDAFDSAGMDLLDRLLALALLRDSFDPRSNGGLCRAQLCDAAGAASHRQQDAVRVRLEETGALRRLRLVQSDVDPNILKRYYRMPPGGRAALQRGDTDSSPAGGPVPKSYPAFAAAALSAGHFLVSAVVPPADGSLGWADPAPDGPGWDYLPPQRRRMEQLARAALSRGAEPLSSALRDAGVLTVSAAAAFLVAAARGVGQAGVPMSVLETSLKEIAAAESINQVSSLFDPEAPLVRSGLITVHRDGRAAATVEISVEKALFERLFPLPVPTPEGATGEKKGEPIEKSAPRFGLDGVVLPEIVRARLDEALAFPSAGAGVTSEWGLGEGLSSPAGVALLFYGPPGTGKTLTAEAVAGQLGRSLWTVRIDQLLSRYIGETEKAIAGVFRAAAEAGDVVLLDEADALLAARSSDSRRWEISQVNVLLQEIERFRGFVILTSNRDESLDPALERRILSRIEFVLPGEAERTSIWRKHLPPRAPLAADVDLAMLARKFPLSGSFIRTAAFLASVRASRRKDSARVITQADLASAAAEQLERVKSRPSIGFSGGHLGSRPTPPLTEPLIKEMTS